MQKDVVCHMCGKTFSIGSTAGRDTSVGRRLRDLLVLGTWRSASVSSYGLLLRLA